MPRLASSVIAALVVAGLGACVSPDPSGPRRAMWVDASGLPRIGTIDPGYQSYNVEMLEVTGGRFWKPYSQISAARVNPLHSPGASSAADDVPAGMSADLYEYRPPLDLRNPRLRLLARALGPAYVRVSGTWANTMYFADTDMPPAQPPQGFSGVLTRAQWRSVVAFARAADAQIVTSVAISAGTRGANHVWRPDLARRWFAFNRSIGGTLAAAEFMNEPTMPTMGGAPAGYDAVAWGRDFQIFRAFMKSEAPEATVLAPGSVGESTGPWGIAEGGYGSMPVLHAEDLMAAGGSAATAFSYHHYGAASQRCAAMGFQTTTQDALSEEWLRRTDQTLAYYRQVRDRFMPGRPFWNTETADAACGGNPWAGTFLDSFRYLDQLGRLAKQEVRVVMHNTLVASDYGLLDERDFTPKPNYWAALLWRRLMGTVVLDAGIPIQRGVHVYAHCLRGHAGGVALLAINNDSKRSRIDIGEPARAGVRYTLSSPLLQSRLVLLNGEPLALVGDERLPPLRGAAIDPGVLVLAPATITFVALPQARNGSCMNATNAL